MTIAKAKASANHAPNQTMSRIPINIFVAQNTPWGWPLETLGQIQSATGIWANVGKSDASLLA